MINNDNAHTIYYTQNQKQRHKNTLSLNININEEGLCIGSKRDIYESPSSNTNTGFRIGATKKKNEAAFYPPQTKSLSPLAVYITLRLLSICFSTV